MRAERRVQVMHQADVAGVVEAFALAQQPCSGEQLLDVFVPGVGQVHLLALLVRPVVALALLLLLPLEPGNELVDLDVELGALLGRARDDQRRARLVDQDRIDLVDDRVLEPALHAVLEPEREVVAQIVEAELVVGAVGDVGAVGRALLVGRLTGFDHAHGEPEEAVDRAHPVRIALRQVLVDRDDVRALARERVQVGGERRDQGLALAGAHLRDLAVMQDHAADQLHVEVSQPQRAPRGLADHRECLGEDVVD